MPRNRDLLIQDERYFESAKDGIYVLNLELKMPVKSEKVV